MSTESRPVVTPSEIDRLTRETESLRKIVSECTAAIGNGSFADPGCSLEFMARVPAEITRYSEKLRAEASLLKVANRDLAEAGRRVVEDAERDRTAAVTGSGRGLHVSRWDSIERLAALTKEG